MAGGNRATLPYKGRGEHAVTCDICGEIRYASQTTFNWKGERVCTDTCFEPRHPQEIPIKVRAENNAAPDPRVHKERAIPEPNGTIEEWPK